MTAGRGKEKMRANKYKGTNREVAGDAGDTDHEMQRESQCLYPVWPSLSA